MKAALPLILCLTLAACGDIDSKKTTMETSSSAPEPPAQSVEKTDAEWKEQLTPEQYQILRKAGTEAPNGEVYKEFKHQGAGTYYCAGCGAELFSSNEKFDSRCGWPSFYDPANAKNVKTSTDYKLGYPRTEVMCAVCGGHLGHVFKGEGFDTPTDQRYCINGTVLVFVPDEEKSEPKPEPSEEEPAKKD
ncbi:peptide-methionine (R)-S-oxide reductase [Haloferula luteola]|uniref:peptide-methionine (R)-S-oxide reductase n=1 Tax=Haloferula luteola TaxID=595692 RepID=A0A840V442_9BACT|nr:peptide-methionine (R)-S-oxide reductase MsrB [Haloferula luteola]MBB5352303.1 peptide-methionine (R)-S-oxide reductase [Haloferula luteola]